MRNKHRNKELKKVKRIKNVLNQKLRTLISRLRLSALGLQTSDYKPSHRIIALFFTIIFLQTLIPYNQLWANNNGPTAPEAAAFEPVDATDMVNLVTGDFSYVLPLLNVPSPEGGYPLALSYHAGIAMDQEASWVGLGWSLNPGAINRSVVKSPDDWYDAKTYNIITSGVNKTSRFGFSAGIGFGDGFGGSIGFYISNTENRAFTGETEYRRDFGLTGSVGLGENSPISINGSIGTDAVSAGVSLGRNGVSANLNVSQSFINGSTTASLSSSDGTGVSLNSKQGLSATYLGAGIGLNNSISGNITPNITKRNIAANLFVFGLSYSERKFWVFEADYTINQGSLYAGAMDEVLQKSIFETKVDFDSYESKNPFLDDTERGSFSFTGYDNYNVSGQGISGTMSPLVIEPGYLHTKQDVISSASGEDAYMVSQYPKSLRRFNNRIDASNGNDIHFYFQNELSSYLNLDTGNWTPNLSNLPTDIFDYDILDNTVVSNLNGETMYVANKNRLKKGKYVETYTNEQISANPNLIFLNNQIDRNDPKLIPSKGIGAFQITAIDGKTYHYTIPVYQREQVTRSSNEEYNIEENYNESQQFEPYATHWLLTAITGPDYIDKNADNLIDKNDYGYWVTFDYGKWSDGYSWRNPTDGESVTEKTKIYSWGIKDIYYLDKIKTRTHTALFIKEDRKDDKSSKIDFPKGSNDLKWLQDIHHGKRVKGNDGEIYLNGIYGTNDYAHNVNIANTYHGYKYKSKIHKSLRLDKIVILKNKDLPSNLSKSNNNEPASVHIGDIEIRERIEGFDSAGRVIIDKPAIIHQRSWNGEFYNNVLDKDDIEALSADIIEKATEVIDFNFDETYPLAKGSFNSDASSKGRLTLKSLSIKGKQGNKLIPDYNFSYNKAQIGFNKDEIDPWGYQKIHPDAWSLSSIQMPTGGKINIKYQSDEISKEIVKGLRVFYQDLQFSFSTDISGNKNVMVRNNPEITDKIDFRNYFEVGKNAFLDALYWRHPPGNTSHRIGDVAGYYPIINVTADQITFQIPNTHLNQNVRRGSNCIKNQWSYYNQLESITGQWFGSIDGGNCGDPRTTSNGTRSKYTFIANKASLENNKQGGIRVSELTTTQNNNSYKSIYDYNKTPNQSSGVTIHTPSDFRKSIGFINELPSPQVMYGQVKVSKYGNDDLLQSSTIYRFKTFDNITYNNAGFSLDDILSLTKSQDQNITNLDIEVKPGSIERVDINFSRHKLTNNLTSLGALLSITDLNSKGQLISKVENEYDLLNNKLGSTKESFKTIKLNVKSGKKKYFLNTSTKEMQIATLRSTKTTRGGISQTVEFVNFDNLTGKTIETEQTLGDGQLVRTKEFLAKDVNSYSPSTGYSMGSKVDNPTNKNMLTQTAANLTQIKGSNGDWKTINADITTWNNNWTYYNQNGTTTTPANASEKIWRKHKTFAWKGQVDDDGAYIGYTGALDDFDWSDDGTQANTKWINTSTVSLYDHYSMPLEAIDINGNKASTKMTDDQSKIIAVSNAGYQEMFYSGAEYRDGNYLEDQMLGGQYQKSDVAHTGTQSLLLDSGNQGFKITLPSGKHREGKYKTSVWVRKSDLGKIRINIKGTTKTFNGERADAGDWTQLNHYEDLGSGNETVYITAAGGSIYVDDFRICPIESSMTSYVYNQWDELSYIIGANNLATHYIYDDAGRLIETQSEVIDNETTDGGFKKTQRTIYNYK
ncbi:hypothetical protein [Aquimarina sp. RZ0]|uniref:hypothetical protein n=1 Tax=Aquimarina sp. RZ0 TaxID=2607730 RepID=UPI0011F12703|nr:hypothetical protein [Aquimarina sp. RZ0]KAA1246528.1 hypothetical protein F0000_07135 [Aquimarina sp. RZ0]